MITRGNDKNDQSWKSYLYVYIYIYVYIYLSTPFKYYMFGPYHVPEKKIPVLIKPKF